MNQSMDYNLDNPAMDVLNDKEDFIAKTQIKNLEIFEYKIILVGDPGVGKTSILTKFVSNEFQSVYSSTIGVEFKLKDIYVNNYCARLKIWDTCGQEKFRSITRQYLKNSNGVFIVFDLTNKDTIKTPFEFLKYCLVIALNFSWPHVSHIFNLAQLLLI